AAAGRAHPLDEAGYRAHVVREIERLGDIARAFVAVIAVGDDPDPDARDLLSEPRDGGPDLLPDLGEARVHAPGGVEAEDDLNVVVDHERDNRPRSPGGSRDNRGGSAISCHAISARRRGKAASMSAIETAPTERRNQPFSSLRPKAWNGTIASPA